MVSKEAKAAQEIVDAIEVHVESFIKKLPNVQKALFEEITLLAKEFIVPAKTIKDQAYNIKLISKIDSKIKEVLITPEYQNNVDEYIDAFDDVVKLQNAYFSTVFVGFKKTQLLDAIKKNAVESALERLTGDEIHGKVGRQITDIIRRNINSSKSYKVILDEVNGSIYNVFQKDFKALVRDSINVFAAEYTKAVTTDLGLKWYIYVGSLMTTSRPFCIELINSKDSCMPFIHESQLNDIAEGRICGKNVSLSGLYKGTDGSNLQMNRGGYNCGHQLLPVSEFVVPQELRDRFK